MSSFSSSSKSGSGSKQSSERNAILAPILRKIKKGDILITGNGVGGLVGHAAIMTCDNMVLEMVGGEGWQFGIPDNNRLISKRDWFYEHWSDSTSVYRVGDSDVAGQAADWAYCNYYNPNGGSRKTKHITYRLSGSNWTKDPSYCSKLVIQAYFFGTKNLLVTRPLMPFGTPIVPTLLPTYFLPPYSLSVVTTF